VIANQPLREAHMLDDMFSFIDPIMEPTSDDMFYSLAGLLEQYFEIAGADAIENLPVRLPERTKIGDYSGARWHAKKTRRAACRV
jgi:hypothetical protein